MNLKRPALLCALLLLLPGCTGIEETGRSYAENLFTKPVILKGELIQQSGEILNTFSIRGEYTDGETVISVLTPEEHQGITARVKTGETRVSFDGTELVIPGERISVFLLLHEGLEGLKKGTFRTVGGENLQGQDCIVLSFQRNCSGTAAAHRVWIGRASGQIVKMDCDFGDGVQSFISK